MNLTPDNVGYFNYASLKRTHPGVFFVNVARGEHAPTADLVRLLDEGHLAGVALDVYENESKLSVALRAGQGTFPLAGRPNVILTPHNAFNTKKPSSAKRSNRFSRSRISSSTGNSSGPCRTAGLKPWRTESNRSQPLAGTDSSQQQPIYWPDRQDYLE